MDAAQIAAKEEPELDAKQSRHLREFLTLMAKELTYDEEEPFEGVDVRELIQKHAEGELNNKEDLLKLGNELRARKHQEAHEKLENQSAITNLENKHKELEEML